MQMNCEQHVVSKSLREKMEGKLDFKKLRLSLSGQAYTEIVLTTRGQAHRYTST